MVIEFNNSILIKISRCCSKGSCAECITVQNDRCIRSTLKISI
ncbi:unnamed protein product [Schistosoma mattheei]|uniref:Uncharacterized protein n=1 Tax=Schistosoma mattheei TaxID=31246 RepID=A0A183PB75_9TREM|nr:unnamed protein product [Schistosoma mattheei]